MFRHVEVTEYQSQALLYRSEKRILPEGYTKSKAVSKEGQKGLPRNSSPIDIGSERGYFASDYCTTLSFLHLS